MDNTRQPGQPKEAYPGKLIHTRFKKLDDPTLTPEEREWQRAAQSKGGQVSRDNHQRRKRMATDLKLLLAKDCKDAGLAEELKGMEMDGTMQEGMLLAVLAKALRGDVESARFIRDTIGEKPREGMDIGFTDAPVAQLDLTKLSDDELRALAAERLRTADPGNRDDGDPSDAVE